MVVVVGVIVIVVVSVTDSVAVEMKSVDVPVVEVTVMVWTLKGESASTISDSKFNEMRQTSVTGFCSIDCDLRWD